MKLKHFIILLFISFLLYFTAAVFRIQHWVGSSNLLMAAWISNILAIVGILYKLITHPKIKNFLNW